MGEAEGGMSLESIEACILPCERGADGKMLCSAGSSIWCSVTTLGGGVGGSKERGLCILTANSHCCMEETNTTL